MQVKRITPEIFKAAAQPTEEKAAGAETARVQNVDVGKCPICKKVLRFSEANHIPVMVCDDHAIVMPIKD